MFPMAYNPSRAEYFLSRVGGELVLDREPNYIQQSDSRILVIGGGVTGLTYVFPLSPRMHVKFLLTLNFL